MTTFKQDQCAKHNQDKENRMKSQREKAIPDVAIQAFSEAFQTAVMSGETICYVKDGLLLEQQGTHIQVRKDLTDAYVVPNLKHSVLKRKRKYEVGV